MESGNEKFEIEYGNSTLKIEQISLPGQVLFKVIFPDSTPPVVVLRATDYNQSRFWTSMPEGRQALAEKIGPLIEQYYRSKTK
ncbi:MAG: hypothetical protein ABI707_12335 [Ferruginibacter sp.]